MNSNPAFTIEPDENADPNFTMYEQRKIKDSNFINIPLDDSKKVKSNVSLDKASRYETKLLKITDFLSN